MLIFHGSYSRDVAIRHNLILKFRFFSVSAFTPLTPEQKESVIRNYLVVASTRTNVGQVKYLLHALYKLVNGNIVTAR